MNGTLFMADKVTRSTFGLSSKEIIEIISVCKQSGVSKMQFGDLCIEFSSQAAAPEKSNQIPVKEITENEHKAMTQKAVAKDERDLKEDRLAMSLLEDPMLAERMIADGDLEDADDSEFNDDVHGE